MTTPTEVQFELHLDADTAAQMYRGSLRFVQVRARDGRSVRFPALWLRPHLSREGVHGQFLLRFDADHRLMELRRLG